ncbi:MAG: hypothetical protein ACR2HB_09455 [Dehalococcoidia bacterium]
MLLRRELDAAFFHLYEIGREDVEYIMETFPIVKRKDVPAHGEYRQCLIPKSSSTIEDASICRTLMLERLNRTWS